MLGLIDPQKNDAGKIHFYELANAFVSNQNEVNLIVPKNTLSNINCNPELTYQLPIKYKENFIIISLLSIFQIIYYLFISSNEYDFVYVRIRLFPCVFLKIINKIKGLRTRIYAEQAGWIAKEVDIQKGGFLRRKIGLSIQLADAYFADKVIVMTQGIKDRLKNYGIKIHKIKVVENGTNIKHFYPLKGKEKLKLKKRLIGSGKLVLGFIGNISKWQGIESLFDAAKKLKQKREDFIILIIGTGIHLKQLKRICRKENLNKFVVFKENIPYSDMNKWINLIDIAFAPKIKELDGITSPLKLRDYAAVGKPVISTEIKGIKEFSKFGWLFTFDQEKNNLYEKINLLIEKPKLLRQAEMDARNYAEQHFFCVLIAQKIAKL